MLLRFRLEVDHHRIGAETEHQALALRDRVHDRTGV
jgi:hypothetical protein